MQARSAVTLRAAIASHTPARGKRYAPDLRGRILEYAQSRRGESASWATIAGELGIAFETLRRWGIAAGPSSSRAMVPVRVVAERAERKVNVASSSGYRIEELTLQEAVAVLRALG